MTEYPQAIKVTEVSSGTVLKLMLIDEEIFRRETTENTLFGCLSGLVIVLEDQCVSSKQ